VEEGTPGHPADKRTEAVGGPPAPDAFVRRSGRELTVGGQPFTFTGINMYNANSRGECWYAAASGDVLADSLEAIRGASGGRLTVLRVWFFQPMATVAGKRDWSAFDHTLAQAREHGFRVVPVLGNQWRSCDGQGDYRDEQWYRDGYRGAAPPGMVPYRDWVAEVVERYRGEPAIAFWQLLNEAEAARSHGGPCAPGAAPALRAFADDVGGLVHSIDPNHLVSLGTIGSGQCGASGEEYRTLHASPGIDLCEYHDYASGRVPLPGDEWNGLAVRIRQCRELDKPIFVGELGIDPKEVGGLPARASAVLTKLYAQFGAGVAGVVVWGWQAAGTSGGDAFSIGPGDPVLGVLGRAHMPGGSAAGNPGGSAGGSTAPPMGYNPYNHFGNSADEKLMREVADAMVANGMHAAGYRYLNVDDSWQGGRDAAGNLTANKRFPSGMKALADYAHAKGLRFGLYTSPATRSCGGRPGSAGHVEQDVRTFASWGVDYIKLDWCGADYSPERAAAIVDEWQRAITAAGRPMLLSINAGRNVDVAAWANTRANVWRTGDDVCASWYNQTRAHDPGARDCYTEKHHAGIYDYLRSSTADHAAYARPGHWADPDMLEVGNPGLTDDEARTHFGLWAMWSAPLLAGNDPRVMAEGDTASRILLDSEVIDIDQDPLGVMAGRIANNDGLEVWFKPLADGDRAVLLINTRDAVADITVPLSTFTAEPVWARNLWEHTDIGMVSGSHTVRRVPAHGSALLRLTPVGRDEGSGSPSEIASSGRASPATTPAPPASLTFTVATDNPGRYRLTLRAAYRGKAPDGGGHAITVRYGGREWRIPLPTRTGEWRWVGRTQDGKPVDIDICHPAPLVVTADAGVAIDQLALTPA
jgi:alpha-galactosidase